jgi:hypothetical protein
MNPELPVRATSTDIYKCSPSAIVRNNHFYGLAGKPKPAVSVAQFKVRAPDRRFRATSTGMGCSTHGAKRVSVALADVVETRQK